MSRQLLQNRLRLLEDVHNEGNRLLLDNRNGLRAEDLRDGVLLQ